MRLFVAIRPPPEVCAHLAAALGCEPDPRWHVTVAFLGEAEQLDLSAVAAKHPPFSVCLEGVARFGTAVGLQVKGDARALGDLAAAVRKACRRHGIPLEHRSYRPHLTVVRGQVPPALRTYTGPTWTVSELELVRSTLGRPVVHDVLARWPLGGVAG